MTPCPICGDSNGKITVATERMFSMPGAFRYRECDACGCLYLLDIPEDFTPYYNDQYYSKVKSRVSLLRKIRAKIYLSRFSFLVDWNPRRDLDALKIANFEKGKSLLDVGCGEAARLVHDLRELGYQAIGIDPFASGNVSDKYGLSVLKSSIFEMDGKYDLVILRHSLEHMPDPAKVMSKIRSLLNDNGVCIISVPVVGWAWKRYGSNWVQLDAPRHLCLFTERGFDILAKNADMQVDRVVYDSNDFQFWASEGLAAGKSWPECKPPARKARRELLRKAKYLNLLNFGDQAQFFLSRRAERSEALTQSRSGSPSPVEQEKMTKAAE